MKDITPQYASIPDWCRLSGMGRTRTYEEAGAGNLRIIKVGGRPLVDVLPDDFRASWAGAEIRDADAFIEEFFSFITLDPRDDDIEADCQWVIDRAADAVIRDGANMLIVDPWNEVEHRRRAPDCDYTGRTAAHARSPRDQPH